MQDYTIEGEKITFTKEELKVSYEHFCKEADKFKPRKKKDFDFRYAYYLGKAEVLHDLLKLFEPIDFV